MSVSTPELRRMGSPVPTQWIAAYKRAVKADPCSYCGGVSEVLDHVTPRARGGSDSWENLTATCSACNSRKMTQSLVGFLGRNASGIDARLAPLVEERFLWRHVGDPSR